MSLSDRAAREIRKRAAESSYREQVQAFEAQLLAQLDALMAGLPELKVVLPAIGTVVLMRRDDGSRHRLVVSAANYWYLEWSTYQAEVGAGCYWRLGSWYDDTYSTGTVGRRNTFFTAQECYDSIMDYLLPKLAPETLELLASQEG